MPLVISQAGFTFVKYEETLAEILGHDDFDGEDWAIGDRIIFENGTESGIKQERGEEFHTWTDPSPADLEEVKRIVKALEARDWKDLFASIERQSELEESRLYGVAEWGMFGLIVAFLVLAAVVPFLLVQWLLSGCSQ